MARFVVVSPPAREDFVVATYRTGSAPPPETLNWSTRVFAAWRGGWWVPSRPFGYLTNVLFFRGRFTIRVAPWKRSGPSWWTRRPSEASADRAADLLRNAIKSGAWNPDLEPIPDLPDAE